MTSLLDSIADFLLALFRPAPQPKPIPVRVSRRR
jgi:hypothetical protein